MQREEEEEEEGKGRDVPRAKSVPRCCILSIWRGTGYVWWFLTVVSVGDNISMPRCNDIDFSDGNKTAGYAGMQRACLGEIVVDGRKRR
jgi:hypothetical protein